ncbi:uncharacterized protein BKA55DRAFT_544803 [Fusarium redolens]|jgi:hypothetical protein|uniref:Uncharacterized protein n=1 Tax=Fusarium redolens TaxID=48865 RepID=A0A9P9G1Y7_FUSRE|nr:uncharacterized protein BKA55DRAFT_544803 [Fusarium redolens]KAF9760739.1 hypothetical protein IL306_004161 [Fusarium sp. DS 682]KAH7231664.1 hypothetical protein BKA55DRAFT_544803 [Fusarium redolens]
MTIGDFFDFDKTEYAHRISHYDLDRLRKQEIVKTRQITAAFCSAQIGTLTALATSGGTFLLSAIGFRRLHVAESKLKLIRAELKKRDVPLHKLQKRDVLIPLGACAVGFGVGHGFDEAAIHVTHTFAPGLFPGDSVAHAFSMNPGDSISGAAHGAAQQLHEMGHAIMSLDNGVSAAQDLARVAISVPQTSVEEAVGFHAGMVAMQAAEKGIASVASSSLATQGMKAMTGDADQMDGLQNY